MNEFNRHGVLPDSDPLLHAQSMLQPPHREQQQQQALSVDDADSQSVDLTDDNLLQRNVYDYNLDDIDANFDEDIEAYRIAQNNKMMKQQHRQRKAVLMAKKNSKKAVQQQRIKQIKFSDELSSHLPHPTGYSYGILIIIFLNFSKTNFKKNSSFW